ncbi:hypothetical protein GBA52_020672 [Prunus armeniaca]|nr:hypothetical protein GBA52_020672 [Prunus armeniaca]
MVLRFKRLEIHREVRLEGSSPSSGNESTASHSSKLTVKCLREVSLGRLHCTRFAMSFLQERMETDFNFEGNPPSKNECISGQFSMDIDWRDGRRACICSGNDLNFLHSLIYISVKSVKMSSCEILVTDSRPAPHNLSILRLGK